jgi:hypothetical protein
MKTSDKMSAACGQKGFHGGKNVFDLLGYDAV